MMHLKRFLLRYYPPGLTLECERADGSVLSKTIDLLHLTPATHLDECISDIIRSEPLIKEKRRQQIKALLQRTHCSPTATRCHSRRVFAPSLTRALGLLFPCFCCCQVC